MLACIDQSPADDGTVKPGSSVAPHAIYNIGNNRPEELIHFIEIIEQATGKTAIRDFRPMQPGDIPATCADIDAIVKDRGYAPTTPLNVGLPKFVEWYRVGQEVPFNIQTIYIVRHFPAPMGLIS